MSKHKKRKHKRVADPYDDYMQKRHARSNSSVSLGEMSLNTITAEMTISSSSQV